MHHAEEGRHLLARRLPGQKPNEWALPQSRETTEQLVAALRKLGRTPYMIEGYLTRPDEAIAKLGPIDDPMVGVFVHWTYAPHTVDGVVGKDNPLLLASNFSGTWPGLVALLNTGASLESVGRPASRVWTDAPDWTADARFMERLDEWCSTGRIALRHQRAARRRRRRARGRSRSPSRSPTAIRRKRVLALMLGDTSMGMINGYFGPRLLYPIGFSEHKVDQAWLIDRVKTVTDARVDDAFKFVQDKGVTFHWSEADAEDFTAEATREQLRGYLAVLDLLDEFKADCLGWQYQLGLLKLLPPSDFAEGLLNSHARPEGNGHVVITSTEADQGNLVPMELMKRLLEAKGLPGAVMFHDVRWGAEHDGRFLWVLLNSGSCGAYAFNHDVTSLQGRPQLPPAGRLLPRARRHLRRRQPARPDHLGPVLDRPHGPARHGPRPGRVGRPARRRPRSLVARHDPPVAVHGRRPRLLDGDGHGPLHEQPHRRRLWRHLRRDGGAQPEPGLQGPDHVVPEGRRPERPARGHFRRASAMKSCSRRETGFPSRPSGARLGGALRRIPSDETRERELAMEPVVIACGGCGAAIRIRHPEKPGAGSAPGAGPVLAMPEAGEPRVRQRPRTAMRPDQPEPSTGLPRRPRRSVPSLVMNTSVMAVLAVWAGWGGLDDGGPDARRTGRSWPRR